MNFKITSKILALCVFLVLLTSLTLGGVNIIQYRKVLIDTIIKEREKEVLLISSSINSNISELSNDTLFLSLTPPISGIIRSFENNGIDPLDSSTEKQWKSRLTTIFKEMLVAKKDYIQIRYIGVKDGGREIVRVDRKGDQVVEVQNEELQQKGEETYFKESIKLKAGEVYLSDFTANREHGEIVYPVEMVLRASVPVYNEDNEVFGIIIINIEYNRIFSSLSTILRGEDQYFVANQKGDILLHTDPNFTVNVKPFKLKNINTILPDLENKDRVLLKNTDASYFEDQNENIYVVERLFYNSQNLEKNLSVFLKIDKKRVLGEVSNKYRRNLYIIIVMIVLSVLLSLYFSRIITTPILELTGFAQTIGKGIKKKRIKVKSHDEIGILGETLNQMSDEIHDKEEAIRHQSEALDVTAIVAETDEKGKITYVNSKFIELSKYTREELIGQDHRILNSGHHSQEFFRSLWTQIKSGNIWHGEIKNKAKDGSLYWVETTIYPVVKNGNVVEKYIAIRYDITEKKKTLGDLKLANEEALKAAQAKSAFLANMSHEIRTPLNGILGFSNLLIDGELKGEQLEHAKLIKDCSEGLLLIINDVLDISKIEAGKLNINRTSVNVKDMLSSAIKVFNSLLLHKEIDLSVRVDDSVPETILIDPLRIRQILINLIGNSIKFTDKGFIRVDVEVDQRIDDKQLRLRWGVEDSGIGIPKDSIAKLFMAFEQVDDSRTREHGGTGLGLTISSKIVELMGGSIWVESEEGVGSKFFFTTTAEESSLQEAKEEGSAYDMLKESNTHNLKILVVEDNKINQKLITKVLAKLGYDNIVIAGNGKEAVSFCSHQSFDLILMDVQMPEMDGYEATRIIKESYRDIVVVGLSANAFIDDKEKGFKSGMSDYLAKPLKVQEISNLLSRYEALLNS